MKVDFHLLMLFEDCVLSIPVSKLVSHPVTKSVIRNATGRVQSYHHHHHLRGMPPAQLILRVVMMVSVMLLRNMMKLLVHKTALIMVTFWWTRWKDIFSSFFTAKIYSQHSVHVNLGRRGSGIMSVNTTNITCSCLQEECQCYESGTFEKNKSEKENILRNGNI